MAKYLFQKRGVYYFERRIPKDVSAHYNAPKIVKSLKTKRRANALALSVQIAQRLDAYWASIRLEAFTPSHSASVLHEARPPVTIETQTMLMSEALKLYIALKGQSRGKRFSAYAQRSIKYLFETASDKPLHQYTRSDANALRNMLISKGLVSSSIKRNFEVVRAIFNVADREGDFGLSNPFSNILLVNAKEGRVRPPLSPFEIENIQQRCFELNDDMRWLIALISDTGLRLAEACGILIDDIKADADVPHIRIKAYPWRQLKTSSSERTVPLVGASLWSAKQLIAYATSDFAFPRYCSDKGHKADSASNALNKWMRPYVQKGAVVHSFRHSLRDRLREVECPSDIIDQIGGWQSYGVGVRYGQGYSLNVMYRWLKAIA